MIREICVFNWSFGQATEAAATPEAAFSFHNLWRTIVKLVMCCSSGSSSDSSAKTDQSVLRVYLAVHRGRT